MRQATLALLRRAKDLPPLSYNLAAPCMYWGAVFFSDSLWRVQRLRLWAVRGEWH